MGSEVREEEPELYAESYMNVTLKHRNGEETTYDHVEWVEENEETGMIEIAYYTSQSTEKQIDEHDMVGCSIVKACLIENTTSHGV